MPWVAKLTGAYGRDSDGWLNNILQMNGQMNGWNMDMCAQAALLGNVEGESGFNPWRWGMRLEPPYDEFVDPSNGYGLFQWTPSTVYINEQNSDLPGYGPNMSVTEITAGATPEDGWAQMEFFKAGATAGYFWESSCWRWYWSDDPNVAFPGWVMTTAEYNYYKAISNNIIATYGHNGIVSFEDFLNCPDIHAATFMFMAGFEGPAWPLSWESRCDSADYIYEKITGETPPEPPGPGGLGKKSKLIYYLKLF